MKSLKDAISLDYLDYDVSEDVSIHEGRFCVYLYNKKYKCYGKVFYKMTTPMAINFKGKILSRKDYDVDITLDYDNAILEVYGYKPINVTITSINDLMLEGYINDGFIKSKNYFVDSIDFYIVNLDRYSGKLIMYEDKLFAGRMEFNINDYEVTIDKRYDFTKELNHTLREKSGSIITHIGRIKKKDGSLFKTNNINDVLDNISMALSFMCGRYVDICIVKGYEHDNNIFRLCRECMVSPFRFVPNWKDTIANNHNIEKYMTLMCKKLNELYYGHAIRQVIDWYIESLGNTTIENNIISMQIALETLSYVVLVEQNKVLTDEEFDENLSSTNIRLLLNSCKIPIGKFELYLFDEYIENKFIDGVDLIIYFRNKIVHPSRKRNKATLHVEDMWNIIQIAIRYVELVILYIIGYKGEYSNRLNERSYGEVELVPWNYYKYD